MYNVELSDIRRKLNDLSRQLDNLARREYTPSEPVVLPDTITEFSGTPTAGRLAQWTGAGTVEETTYAGSSVLRYIGVPSAGRYAYFTANGTVADSGFGTASLPRYSGAPVAGRYTYWTADGTVAASSFGTADLPRYTGTPTGSALATWSGAGTLVHGSVNYSHASGTPVLAPASSHALRIHDASGNMAFNITNNSIVESSKGLYITQTSPTTGNALSVFRSLTSGQTDSPLVYLNNNSASDDQPTLRVNQGGTASIAEFQLGGSNAVVITRNGSVGINESSPDTLLHLTNSVNSVNYVKIENPNTGSLARAGIQATTDGGDTFIGAASAASVFEGGGFFYTAANIPFSIWTNNTERVWVAGDGLVGINASPPAGQLHVRQASTTAAIPALILQQNDLSEEFIEFDTTVGAGNPIDTAGVGADYGRLRVMVTGVGYKYIKLSNG